MAAPLVIAGLLLGSAPAALVGWGGVDAGAAAPAQPHGEGAGQVSEPAVAEGHTAEEQHAESPWAFVGKVLNFAILAATLVYFLRNPIRRYLSERDTQIREDLIAAAAMNEESARQIAEIEEKLKRLPHELDALRARGREEIEVEEGRIHEVAAGERERLLDQTRREIELQLRIARRDLVAHAADLAVQVAAERIRAGMTDADQLRLVDRYVTQVRSHD